jgi:hypothetical protein
MMKNALKLVSEVIPHNGGRMLLLRSVFKVVNHTSHPLHLLASYSNEQSVRSAKTDDTPFTILPGESFHVPLALLHKSATQPTGRGLGTLWIRPADLSQVKESLENDFSHLLVEQIEYPETPIDLISLVEESASLLQSTILGFRPDGSLVNSSGINEGRQLCCFIQARPKRARRGHSTETVNEPYVPINNKLPPFSYNVDVRRIEPSLTKFSSKKENNDGKISRVTKFALNRINRLVSMKGQPQVNWKDDHHPPLHYSIGNILLTVLSYLL